MAYHNHMFRYVVTGKLKQYNKPDILYEKSHMSGELAYNDRSRLHSLGYHNIELIVLN